MPQKQPRLSENAHTNLRFRRTLDFLMASLPPPARILDLGTNNEMAEIMRQHGYTVTNTEGDLDEIPETVGDGEVDAVTAFEILEHLVGPLQVLREVKAKRLITTIPLRLWFAKAYRNPKDRWDQHFHEFESWQFDWLLEKAGWKIVRTKKWNSPVRQLGIRPLLRLFTPRYYAVEAVKAEPSSTES